MWAPHLVGESEWDPPTPPPGAAKPSVRLDPLLDDLKEFTFRPYDDCESVENSHRFASLFPEDYVDTQLEVPSYDACNLVAAVILGYLPGYYKGEFYAEAYNLNRVALQDGFDQDIMVVLPTDPPELHHLGRFKLPQDVMRLHNLGFSAKGKRSDDPTPRSKTRSKQPMASMIQETVRSLCDSLPQEAQ
ncbi:hypothetical protein MKW98_023343, partial [Papaver atlanticum]